MPKNIWSSPNTIPRDNFPAPPPPPYLGLCGHWPVRGRQWADREMTKLVQISLDPLKHTHNPSRSGALTSERWRGPVSPSHLIFIRHPPQPWPRIRQTCHLGSPCVCLCRCSSDHVHEHCGHGPGCAGGQSVCVCERETWSLLAQWALLSCILTVRPNI